MAEQVLNKANDSKRNETNGANVRNSVEKLKVQKFRYHAAAQAAKDRGNWNQFLHHTMRVRGIQNAIDMLEKRRTDEQGILKTTL